jgi:hypothetical protein
MQGSRPGTLFAFVACFALVLAIAPSGNAITAPYLTTGLNASSAKQSTIAGFNGVLLNYTNSYSSPTAVFIYLDLLNQAGQTTYWNVGYFSFNANQKVSCFIAVSPSVPAGNYSAKVFATTTSGIPVSIATTIQVRL